MFTCTPCEASSPFKNCRGRAISRNLEMSTAGEEIASLYQREREPELRERRALVERARALERGDRAADVQAAQEPETEHAMRVTE